MTSNIFKVLQLKKEKKEHDIQFAIYNHSYFNIQHVDIITKYRLQFSW